jgi:hypothetical protein
VNFLGYGYGYGWDIHNSGVQPTIYPTTDFLKHLILSYSFEIKLNTCRNNINFISIYFKAVCRVYWRLETRIFQLPRVYSRLDTRVFQLSWVYCQLWVSHPYPPYLTRFFSDLLGSFSIKYLIFLKI